MNLSGSSSDSSCGSSLITRVTSPWQEIDIRHHPRFGHQLVIDGDLQISESDRSCNVAMASPLVMLGSFGRVAMLLRAILLLPAFLPIAAFLLLNPGTAEAQRQATRSLLINPLLDERHHMPEGEVNSFNMFGGWAGFGHFVYSSDDHHLWHQDLGGYVELWRQGSSQSLLLTGHIQFIADPHNDINFNPRAIFWEEGLVYTARMDPGYLQLGFLHRCKHDIDNLDRGKERSLIFSSVTVRYQQPLSLFRENDLLLMGAYDNYLITWDRRIPRELEERGPDWNDLDNEFTLQAHWQGDPTGSGPFVDSRIHLLSLDRNLYINRGLSAGWQVHRSGGAFRVALGYEYLHDSGVPAIPEGVHLVSVGIRANTAFVIR